MDWWFLRDALQQLGAVIGGGTGAIIGGGFGAVRMLRFMMSLVYRANRTWPFRIVVIATTSTWNDRTGGEVIYLDVSYSLEPRVTPTIVQAVGIEFEGDWFEGSKQVVMTETLNKGNFPIGERVDSATAPYKSRFVVEGIPETRNQVRIKSTIVVGGRGKSCKAKMEDVLVIKA